MNESVGRNINIDIYFALSLDQLIILSPVAGHMMTCDTITKFQKKKKNYYQRIIYTCDFNMINS